MPPHRTIIDRETLHQLYVIEQRSLTETARLCYASVDTIRLALKAHGIEIRPKGPVPSPDCPHCGQQMPRDVAFPDRPTRVRKAVPMIDSELLNMRKRGLA